MTNVARTVLVAFAVLSVLGCSTTPPAPPATEVSALAGEWRGMLYGPAGGPPIGGTIIIEPNGNWTAKSDQPLGPNRLSEFKGTVAVENGKYRYRSQTTGNTGTWTLQQGATGKRLTATQDGGGTAEYTFVK